MNNSTGKTAQNEQQIIVATIRPDVPVVFTFKWKILRYVALPKGYGCKDARMLDCQQDDV